MEKDLIQTVRGELWARKGQWKRIAASVPDCSYSFISQFARGKYKSAPSYKRLRALADLFEKAA